MSIIETRLFELACKGERLDAINAEEILDRRAAAQAKATARWLAAQRWSQQLFAWRTTHLLLRKALSGVAAK